MSDQIVAQAISVQFDLILGVVAAAMVLEAWRPRIDLGHSLRSRWLANGGLFLLSQVLIWLALPATVIGASLLAREHGWGLFNAIEVPAVAAFVIAWLALDGAGYALHRFEHASRLLWRLHRQHHSDPDLDVTTSFRFHPVEALLQAGLIMLVALVLGAPPLAAVAYSCLVAIIAPLSHTNIALPRPLESMLRWLVITPDMHRTHHSTDAADHGTNYSVCLSIWDRLFGTYREAPAAGHDSMRFGLESRTPAESISLVRILLDPLLGEPNADPDRGRSPAPAEQASSPAQESRA